MAVNLPNRVQTDDELCHVHLPPSILVHTFKDASKIELPFPHCSTPVDFLVDALNYLKELLLVKLGSLG